MHTAYRCQVCHWATEPPLECLGQDPQDSDRNSLRQMTWRRPPLRLLAVALVGSSYLAADISMTEGLHHEEPSLYITLHHFMKKCLFHPFLIPTKLQRNIRGEIVYLLIFSIFFPNQNLWFSPLRILSYK